MKSTVSVRGQTVIPKEIREAFGIEPQTKLDWKVKDGTIVVRPLPVDPVRAMYGILKGKGSVEEFLEERRAERDREEAADREFDEMLRKWRATY